MAGVNWVDLKVPFKVGADELTTVKLLGSYLRRLEKGKMVFVSIKVKNMVAFTIIVARLFKSVLSKSGQKLLLT
jgi:hypothetical protein